MNHRVHAHVEKGRVIVDDSTDLPDGTRLEMLVLDSDASIPADEELALLASLERGIADADQGRTIPAEAVLARFRSR